MTLAEQLKAAGLDGMSAEELRKRLRWLQRLYPRPLLHSTSELCQAKRLRLVELAIEALEPTPQ